jgi:hypothetical protein
MGLRMTSQTLPRLFAASALLGACAFGVAACNLLAPVDCTTELGIEISPREQRLRVGHEFTARATGITCGGRRRFAYDVAWVSTDTAVVRVDERSGTARGVAPGTAFLHAHDSEAPSVPLGAVRVVVAP